MLRIALQAGPQGILAKKDKNYFYFIHHKFLCLYFSGFFFSMTKDYAGGRTMAMGCNPAPGKRPSPIPGQARTPVIDPNVRTFGVK
jgi:hypothetical protein